MSARPAKPAAGDIHLRAVFRPILGEVAAAMAEAPEARAALLRIAAVAIEAECRLREAA